MSEAGSAKKKVSVQDFTESYQQQNTQQTVQESVKKEERLSDAAFQNISANSFFQIFTDNRMSPEEKRNAAAVLLTYTDNAEQAQVKLEEFNKFKEYLQFERKRMAQEIIALTDTEAFSELKQVFEDINVSLLNFENQIKPLTDVVDAVYTLRMNGVTYDIFQELLSDREAREKRLKEKAEKEKEFNLLEGEIKQLRNQNAVLSENKILFGFGPTKKSAREDIAKNDLKLKDLQNNLKDLISNIKDLSVETQEETKFADFKEEKEKLRQLLDISSAEHKGRQEELVKSAQNFINTTETRVESVLSHFQGMNGQIDNLDNANYTMRSMYAILNDATKQANEKNETRRQQIIALEDNAQGDLEKMTYERNQRELERHISNLRRSNVDTTSVFAELTASGHRILSMREANEQQVSKTRQLHTSGVAGVADQLSTVLQAVSAAALGESSEAAKMSLERMHKTTSELSQKEVIRVALGTKEINQDLSKAFEDLAEYGEVIKTATSITREGLTETKSLLSKIEQQAIDTQEAVRESLSTAADVVAGKGGAHGEAAAAEEPSADENNNPSNPKEVKSLFGF